MGGLFTLIIDYSRQNVLFLLLASARSLLPVALALAYAALYV